MRIASSIKWNAVLFCGLSLVSGNRRKTVVVPVQYTISQRIYRSCTTCSTTKFNPSLSRLPGRGTTSEWLGIFPGPGNHTSDPAVLKQLPQSSVFLHDIICQELLVDQPRKSGRVHDSAGVRVVQ